MIKKINSIKGITLISLVITIIVLLILAGVTIVMITGDNGILKYSKTASEKYSEESARERLEVKLAEMQTEKIINKEEYNENEYLTEQLSKVGFGVSGDIVIVDGWQFQIDRSVPKIELSLGKGKINEEMKIELSQEVEEDYTKSIITIKVTSAEEIKSIIVNGEEITNITLENGVYTITREVTENKTYSILVKDKNDNYNMNTIAITDLTENMDIYTEEELVAFREKVNSGATYEGKTINLMDNLDLSTVCGEGIGSWIPIVENYLVNKTHRFKGTFEGNNHTISNLYISGATIDGQGLFGKNAGTIQNLILENITINASANGVGGLVGINENTGSINNIKISGVITIGGSFQYIGGIVGWNEGSINKVENRVTVTGYNYVAGVAAYNSGTITKSCNYGEIKANNLRARTV